MQQEANTTIDQQLVFLRAAASLLLFAITVCFQSESHASEPVVFARDIQPLLAKHCLVCHGPDEAEAGLRLDTAEHSRDVLNSGNRAIQPGRPDASELVRRITSGDESLRMPPDGEPLTNSEIDRMRRWISAGGEYQQHWAYRPVTKQSLPSVAQTDWIRNPIDRFILARLEQEGIAPSPQADRATLIKRLSFDLIGLPPTPRQVDSFVHDNQPDAYEKLVNQLLGSPHFGERWGRHWLDKARYADTDGYEKDRPRPNAWRYRDWVIQAINQDMPFDQFTIEQLAGDLLPDGLPSQKLATAFHRQTLTNTEGGTDQEEFRVEATFDRTETTGAIWMGLTMTCARCHTHKYDQISQKEYYQLFAFFNNTNEATTEIARSEVELERYQQQKDVHDKAVAALELRYQEAVDSIQPKIDDWLTSIRRTAASSSPVEFHPVEWHSIETESDAELKAQDDGSLLAVGEVPETDRYTLVTEGPLPTEGSGVEITGVRVELISDSTLAANGPGRAPNGNFVLSQFQLFMSEKSEASEFKPIELVNAEADFSQSKFPPGDAIAANSKSGWAISPKMGKNHHITFYLKKPLSPSGDKSLKVVLSQQYGGKHTIGRFRITLMSGSDPLKSLPKEVSVAVTADSLSSQQQRAVADHVASTLPETANLLKQLGKLKSSAPVVPMLKVRVLTDANRSTRVLTRGDFLQPSDEVVPSPLEVIASTHPLKPRDSVKRSDRLDLANWLVHPNHPLTARVTVNQIWGHLFGRGLVATVDDFGVRGAAPTHPELLDWLAGTFVERLGWKRKALIKTIVLSATYRQASNHRPRLREVDPTNQLLARQNRIRVEAEIIRDLSLAVSGLLSREIGGPSVFPPLPPGVAELSYANNFKWATSEGTDRYRRGMYTFFKRTSPHPTLISFDCPDSNTTSLRRETSNTPLQALITMNNDVFTEAAQAMARRVIQEGGTDDADRLVYALRLCLMRVPRDFEINQFQNLLAAAVDHYESHPEDAKALVSRHPAGGVSLQKNAAWIATVRMILNLDEFIVRD